MTLQPQLPRVGLQAGGLDACHRADLVVVRCVAADADAAEILTQPRASRTVTTRGFSFFSTPLASATSRILRAISSVSSAMDRFLCETGGIRVGSRAVEAHRQHARDMKGCTVRAILDLMPARGAVRDDQCRIIRLPHGRQQR